MRHTHRLLLSALATAPAALLVSHPAAACAPAVQQGFGTTLQRVLSMPGDPDLQQRASTYGLGVMNVMWEDTGRLEGSSVGPNISDLTLQVREKLPNGGVRTHPLPVIRHPNFTDKTGDVALDKLYVRVGNHRGDGTLQAVPLKEVLGSLREYLTDPRSLKGSGNFLAARDSHALVSAQHVFLPIPAQGKVEFNPVIYNYQSSPGAPAVLTLLITREGLSATVVENRAGEQTQQGQGQQLFFNQAGQKTAFTAERKSAVKARVEGGQATAGDDGALEEGADMMMVVQVPLKQRERPTRFGDGFGLGGMAAPPASAAPTEKAERRGRRDEASNVEAAVLGHGDALGRFVEMNGLTLERDARFPVRVTVQFYKATSNGVVDAQDLADVNGSIAKVYASADYVGSLVVPQTQQRRPTGWTQDAPRALWGLLGG